MEQRDFGRTGLLVPALGLGAGHIGSPEQDDADVRRLLDAALDTGVTLLDTARGYGLSEERIGRLLQHRRAGFVLSTKVGYDIPGTADWTAEAIRGGVDAALRRLRTDVLDICFLHSCGLGVLTQGAVIAALRQAQQAGKVRVAGYSGEGDALAWAIASGQFGAVQTSVNLADQWTLATLLPKAAEAGLGVVAKRPLANAPWRSEERPAGHYAEPYWERLHAMGRTPADGDWAGTAIRFSAFAPGVSTAIVGTASPDHLLASVAAVARGPLPDDEAAAWRSAFAPHLQQWPPQV